MPARSRARLVPSARPPLRRALGQHHLRDGRVCRPLVDHLRLGSASTVVEIGPGGGALTRELLASGGRVVAVELDPIWAFALRARLRDGRRPPPHAPLAAGSAFPPPSPLSGRRPSLTIVAADALTLDWAELPPGWRVTGNLPYNVGTAIVERLLRAAPVGTRAGFLLQREVVERMVAEPGDEGYGALSLLVAMRAHAERLAIVRPGAFVPRPAVDSAFVGLELVAPPLAEPRMGGLERLVRAAFAQRRKSLRNALATVYGRGRAEAALAAAGIASSRRAEQLGLAEFLALAAELGNS